MIKFLIALLLYLPTTFLVGSYAYFLFIPIALICYRKEMIYRARLFLTTPFKFKYLISFWLVLLLLIGIVLNSFFGNNLMHLFNSGTLVLFPLTILASYVVADQGIYRFLLLFIVVEVLVGVLEYIIGVNSLFSSLPKHDFFTNYASLYKTRVFGLSSNSSFLAQKCLLGFLMVYFVDLRLKSSQLMSLFLLLITGIILTFGRTVIVVVVVTLILYFSLYLYNFFRQRNYFQITMNKVLFYNSAVFSFLILSTLPFWTNQFNRMGLPPHQIAESKGTKVLDMAGIGNVEMAGRRELWGEAIGFIFQNPVSGNHSKRFLVDHIHVHNSFLEYLTTHGIVLFLVMCMFVSCNINKTNLFFIGCIAIYSLGQFGIFWDISFLDIVFMSMLLFSVKIINPESYETGI